MPGRHFVALTLTAAAAADQLKLSQHHHVTAGIYGPGRSALDAAAQQVTRCVCPCCAVLCVSMAAAAEFDGQPCSTSGFGACYYAQSLGIMSVNHQTISQPTNALIMLTGRQRQPGASRQAEVHSALPCARCRVRGDGQHAAALPWSGIQHRRRCACSTVSAQGYKFEVRLFSGR